MNRPPALPGVTLTSEMGQVRVANTILLSLTNIYELSSQFQ